MPEPVTLRPVTEADVETLFHQQLDPEATHMAAFPARDRDAFFAHWKKIFATESATVRTILFGDAIAGNIVSWDNKGERDVGYWIGREFWGKGVASKALAAFLKVDTTRPLFAHVAKHNAGSIRVLEKCGFVRTGEDVVPSGTGDDEVGEFLYRLDG